MALLRHWKRSLFFVALLSFLYLRGSLIVNFFGFLNSNLFTPVLSNSQTSVPPASSSSSTSLVGWGGETVSGSLARWIPIIGYFTDGNPLFYTFPFPMFIGLVVLVAVLMLIDYHYVLRWKSKPSYQVPVKEWR